MAKNKIEGGREKGRKRGKHPLTHRTLATRTKYTAIYPTVFGDVLFTKFNDVYVCKTATKAQAKCSLVGLVIKILKSPFDMPLDMS